jgi:hypothetical protein
LSEQWSSPAKSKRPVSLFILLHAICTHFLTRRRDWAWAPPDKDEAASQPQWGPRLRKHTQGNKPEVGFVGKGRVKKTLRKAAKHRILNARRQARVEHPVRRASTRTMPVVCASIMFPRCCSCFSQAQDVNRRGEREQSVAQAQSLGSRTRMPSVRRCISVKISLQRCGVGIKTARRTKCLASKSRVF